MAFDVKQFVRENKDKKYGAVSLPSLSVVSNKSIKTSQGLYDYASQNGLQKQADSLLAKKGEESTIFSGGFISDIFDTLNALNYGVVGMLKGKSFSDGVKNRESFSDKDSLGSSGLVGSIAGIALDIAVDPLTYIAPFTVLKKIPGATKLAGVAKKTAEDSKLGKYLGDKFVYMLGQSQPFREVAERGTKNILTGNQHITELLKGVVDLPKNKLSGLLTRKADGRFIRKPLEELSSVLTPEEINKVSSVYSHLDKLGKEAVDLGLLNKGTWEQNVGEYIKNTYMKYEKPEGKTGVFGWAKNKVAGVKKVKDLTAEQRLAAGQIDNPAYLLLRSMVDLNCDIQNTKMFNEMVPFTKKFKDAGEATVNGFKKLPDTKRFFTTATGEKIQMYTKVKGLNQELKPLLKELKKTFKADKVKLSEIHKLEKELLGLSKIREDEFYKFFNEGTTILKKTSDKTVKMGVPIAEKLPKELFEISQKIKKGEKYDEIVLEKLYQEGVLERNGFSSIKKFVDYIKAPAGKIEGGLGESVLKGDIQRLISIQKQIEKLIPKLENIKEIDKRSINDSYRFLEDSISKIQLEKEKAFENIGDLKLGELSGKYVPEPIHKYLTEVMQPTTDTGNLLNKVVGEFKFNKVILNPATHARNIMSNMILNYWKLGMNPIKDADVYFEAIKEMKKGGKWIKEAKTAGYGLDTLAANELKYTLLKEGSGLGGKLLKVRKNLVDIYQSEENFAKLSAFIFNRKKKGLGIEEAWKKAEEATFNYAQVTPFIRKLRQSIWGFPFITFTTKATPLAIETAFKSPTRISVIGKIKNAIENQTDQKELERERASEPAWIRNGFYIKLPMKDEKGRSAYFDMTYIIPFGDLVSGQFLGGQVDRETGTEETTATSLMSNAPAFNLLKEIGKNQDFYGDKIWNDSDTEEKRLKDLFRHITKTMMPPVVSNQIPGGYIQSGSNIGQQRNKSALSSQQSEETKKTLMQNMLSQVGLKVQPINADIQETYMEWEKKKALETLLKEKGLLSEYSSSYIPKEKTEY